MAFFTVVQAHESIPSKVSFRAYPIRDKWDDWGKFRTQFRLVVFDQDGTRLEPGDVKIGEIGLKPGGEAKPGVRAPTLGKPV